MTKQEFLDELRMILSGEVSSEIIMDTYRYYSTYIEDKMRDGKTEEEVVEELGKPSLIARSIIAAQSGEREADEIYTEDGKTRRVKQPLFSNKSENSNYNNMNQNEKKSFVFRWDAWYAKVLYVLVLFLLFLFVLGVVRIGFYVFVKFGIPILLILGVVYLLMYIFSKK